MVLACRFFRTNFLKDPRRNLCSTPRRNYKISAIPNQTDPSGKLAFLGRFRIEIQVPDGLPGEVLNWTNPINHS
jgi:hypothetical protein